MSRSTPERRQATARTTRGGDKRMNRSPLEAVSALVVSLVLIATMIYSVVSHEDHDHASSRSSPVQHQAMEIK